MSKYYKVSLRVPSRLLTPLFELVEAECECMQIEAVTDAVRTRVRSHRPPRTSKTELMGLKVTSIESTCLTHAPPSGEFTSHDFAIMGKGKDCVSSYLSNLRKKGLIEGIATSDTGLITYQMTNKGRGVLKALLAARSGVQDAQEPATRQSPL